MNTKKIILIISLTALIFGIYIYINRNTIVVRGGEVTFHKFDTLPDSSEIIDEDIVLHKLICSDYNVGWESFDLSKKKNKIILFDSASGKILIYYIDKEYKKQKFDGLPADKVFVWNLTKDTPKELYIEGEFGFTDADTIMNWKYDKIKNILTDESGLIFNKINLKQ